MSKKVRWNDKALIESAVQKSSNYTETLKTLGLKAVSANTATLKKYIGIHKIDTSHFGGIITTTATPEKVISNPDHNSDVPRVEIVGEVSDPHKGIGIELDWNDAFVRHLRDNGYTGASDEAIVQYYLTHLIQSITEDIDDDTKQSEFEG